MGLDTGPFYQLDRVLGIWELRLWAKYEGILESSERPDHSCTVKEKLLGARGHLDFVWCQGHLEKGSLVGECSHRHSDHKPQPLSALLVDLVSLSEAARSL